MRSPSMREVLAALEWVRGEMWRFSSPDFIRAAQSERRIGELCARLARGGAGPQGQPRREARKADYKAHR